MKNVITGWLLASFLSAANSQPTPPLTWRELPDPGWWIASTESGSLITIMRNDGLLFLLYNDCPPGKRRDMEELAWYAGETRPRIAIDCDGRDVSAAITITPHQQFGDNLPVLPRIMFRQAYQNQRTNLPESQ